MRAMSGLTLDQAQTRLAEYYAAEAAVLKGQRYEIAGRSLVRADLTSIRAGITEWESRVKALSLRASGRRRVVTPRPGF